MNLHEIVTTVLNPMKADFAVHSLGETATVIAATGDEITLRSTGPQQYSWSPKGGPRLRTPFMFGTALDAESVLRQWTGEFELAGA